ncbi:MAG: CorA family divalent cation transporter [Nitrososphaerota archaeon]
MLFRVVEKFDGLEFLRHDGVVWVNVNKPSQREMDMLGRHFPFSMLNLEDCISKVQLPKIDVYPNHIFAILHFPPNRQP